MRRLLPFTLLALTACASQGDKEADKYRMVAEAGQSAESQQSDLCQQARTVVQAYLDENNEEEYRRWKLTADLDCASLAEWEHLAS